jgi:hypothetical protein
MTLDVPLGASLSFTPMPPTIYDTRGNIIQNSTIGHPVVISKNFTNNSGNEIDFTLLIEVRDESGITQYLAWQTGRASPMATRNAGVSWTPNSAGEYQIRTFAISNLTNPQVLDVVETAQFSVFEPERERKVYSLELDGRKYDIEYSMNSGFIKDVVVDNDLATITLQLERITSDTDLIIELQRELLLAAFSCDQGLVLPEDLDAIAFVDSIQAEIYVIDADATAVTWKLALDASAKRVELVGACY